VGLGPADIDSNAPLRPPPILPPPSLPPTLSLRSFDLGMRASARAAPGALPAGLRTLAGGAARTRALLTRPLPHRAPALLTRPLPRRPLCLRPQRATSSPAAAAETKAPATAVAEAAAAEEEEPAAAAATEILRRGRGWRARWRGCAPTWTASAPPSRPAPARRPPGPGLPPTRRSRRPPCTAPARAPPQREPPSPPHTRRRRPMAPATSRQPGSPRGNPARGGRACRVPPSRPTCPQRAAAPPPEADAARAAPRRHGEFVRPVRREAGGGWGGSIAQRLLLTAGRPAGRVSRVCGVRARPGMHVPAYFSEAGRQGRQWCVWMRVPPPRRPGPPRRLAGRPAPLPTRTPALLRRNNLSGCGRRLAGGEPAGNSRGKLTGHGPGHVRHEACVAGRARPAHASAAQPAARPAAPCPPEGARRVGLLRGESARRHVAVHRAVP
jgi:hypothetical protein